VNGSDLWQRQRLMLEEIIIAGFGGQGIIFAGKIISEAALI
jgi:Pyruvate/2-oxoacid:ferredoxin oxidoreductase gamma subunit